MQPNTIHEALKLLQELTNGYYFSNVPRITKPSPLEFYRNYVSQNRPVIITDLIQHWPALKLWTSQYLRNVMGETEVTVDATPNGWADAIVNEKYFVQPEKRKMKFSKFMDYLSNPKKYNAILYIEHQNSNFTTDEFKKLWKDAELEIEWASQIFNSNPDAVNFWMGESQSITSLHKDHYENMYAVVAGEKHFTLLPPTNFPYLYQKHYPCTTYQQKSNGDWIIKPDSPPTTNPWLSVDPHDVDLKKYPLFKNATPIEVVVKAGEVLYLPSLWFHKVRQKEDSEGKVIAINYWYDMEYGPLYNYYKFLEKLSETNMNQSKN